jgi:hypothetical protein
MSKKCQICGQPLDSGVVCHPECAILAEEEEGLKPAVDIDEAVRLLELREAGRLLIIPEDLDDIGNSKLKDDALTWECKDGGFYVDESEIEEEDCDGYKIYTGNAILKLREYETLGLTPDEIKAIVAQNIALTDMLRCYREKDFDVIEKALRLACRESYPNGMGPADFHESADPEIDGLWEECKTCKTSKANEETEICLDTAGRE